jgi:6,7-dimethyl-8-ribityllumazine synthase
MASSLKNLSHYNPDKVPSGEEFVVGIVVSEWNHEITGALYNGALDALLKHKVKLENIHTVYVPGAFELTYGAQSMINNLMPDAVIVLGCVIRGGTPHFEYVCGGVTQGITKLNAETDCPVIFGVLTTEDQQQALDRAGGIHGNKGIEAAITALKMIELRFALDEIGEHNENFRFN